MATNLADKEVNELIEFCKELGLDSKDYLTKNNKPRAKGVIIKAIEKFMKNQKPYKAEPTNKNIKNSMEDIQEINEIVWTLENNGDTNTNYRQIKEKLKNTITKCHNLLRDEKAVVGTKAQNDIMKILTIHILQHQFQNEDSELYKRCKNVSQEKYNIYIPYCCDLNNILNSIKEPYIPVNEWKKLVNNFLKDIFNGIYADEDSTFNFGNDERTFMKLIEIVCELKIDKDFIDAFSTSFGDIHEAFREYSGGKGAKELGQFFTPRHLIHAILHGCGLNEMIKEYDSPSIYDPCMGTGGLLTRAYSNGNILPNNIYGCETERDTIKFGQISTLLATGAFNSNLQLCNSLCDNKFVGTKKFDNIITNPPFGTKMNYKELEKRFNENKVKVNNPINIGVDFKEVYPIVSNNGTCLFMQHCIYMLEENGTCAIVLPDGELFTGNSFKKFREYMCQNVNILKIINVGGKAFEHTAIKTAVIIFQKNGSTKNIEFMDIPDDCNSVKRLMIVPINNIENNSYSLSYNAYITKKDTEYGEDVVVKTLGEVCEFQNGKAIKKDELVEGEYPVIGGGQKPMGFHNKYNTNENTILCSSSGAYSGFISKYNKRVWASDCFSIIPKDNINNSYIYYFLKMFQEKIYKLQTGLAQPHVYSKNLEQLKIPIPSLERQQEIVEECEQITKSIDTIKLRKEQLKCDGILLKKYYKHNELNEIYKNSEVKTLAEVSKINYGKRITKTKDEGSEYLAYGGGDLMSYKVNQYNRDGITYKVSRDGLSKHNCITKLYGKLFLNDTALTLDTLDNNIVSNNYIGEFLLSKKIYIYNNCTHGAAQLHIDIDKLMEIKIPIPSLENQEKVVAYYEQMTDEYKKHILDKIDEHNRELEMYKELCVNMFSL